MVGNYWLSWIFFWTVRRFKGWFLDWSLLALRLRLLFIVNRRLMDWFTRVNTRPNLDIN